MADVLPAHWTTDEPTENEDIMEGLNCCFSTILQKWGTTDKNPKPLLLLSLAALVHHSDWLNEIVSKHPGHPFGNIPLLNRPELLARLKPLVTLEPIGNVTKSTGIPPHIEQARTLSGVLDICKSTLEQVKTFAGTIKDAVSQVFEEKAIEQGNITGHRFNELMVEWKDSVVGVITEKLEAIQAVQPVQVPQGPLPNPDSDDDDDGGMMMMDADDDDDQEPVLENDGTPVPRPRRRPQIPAYNYDGRLGWAVPKDFKFPANTKLDSAWRLWLSGCHNNGKKVRPFRDLRPGKKAMHFPTTSLSNTFNVNWRPILHLMELAPHDEPIHSSTDEEYIQSTYKVAYEWLKTQRMQFAFKDNKCATWTVGTWSKECAPSNIQRKGTAHDRTWVGEVKGRNTTKRKARTPPSN
jgi:hypothetical protein